MQLSKGTNHPTEDNNVHDFHKQWSGSSTVVLVLECDYLFMWFSSFKCSIKTCSWLTSSLIYTTNPDHKWRVDWLLNDWLIAYWLTESHPIQLLGQNRASELLMWLTVYHTEATSSSCSNWIGHSTTDCRWLRRKERWLLFYFDICDNVLLILKFGKTVKN